MRAILLGALPLLCAAGVADAQTVDDVEIVVAGYQLSANGGENRTVARTSAVIVGKPISAVFSMLGCGQFAVLPGEFVKDATAGWRVQITPTRVADHVVTFRLRWIRGLDMGQGFVSPNVASEDIEVTLKPGETRPLDSVPVPVAGTVVDGRPCNTKAVSLRVSAEFPSFDRRLVAADLWLVERLPNGREESQLQSVRGLPHRPVSFYFDSIAAAKTRLDFFGSVVAHVEQGGIKIELETVRAGAHPGQRGYQSLRWFRSTLELKPDEIVEVSLQDPDDKTSAAANRLFSIRLRVKQVR